MPGKRVMHIEALYIHKRRNTTNLMWKAPPQTKKKNHYWQQPIIAQMGNMDYNCTRSQRYISQSHACSYILVFWITKVHLGHYLLYTKDFPPLPTTFCTELIAPNRSTLKTVLYPYNLLERRVHKHKKRANCVVRFSHFSREQA